MMSTMPLKSLIKRWIVPDLFPDDAEKNGRAHLVLAVILGLDLFALLGMASLVIAPFDPALPLVVLFFLLMMNQFCHWLLFARKLRLASFLVVIENFIFPALMVIVRGSVLLPIAAFFVAPVIICGGLYGKRGVVLSTILSSISIGILMICEAAGLLPQSNTALSANQWITFVVLFGMMGIFSYTVNEQTRNALERIKMEIAERQRTEDSLRLIERRNSALIEKSPGGVALLDHKGCFTYGSPSTYRMFGYTSEELIGEMALAKVHPDDAAALHAQFMQLVKDMAQSSFSAEYRFRTQTGSYLWVEGTFTNLLDEPAVKAIVNNLQDISARKQADAALRTSQEKFAKAFLSSPDAIVLNSLEDGRYLDVNDSFLRDTGYSREELIGQPITGQKILGTPEDRERMAQALATQGFVRNMEVQYQRKSGEIRHAQVSAEVIVLENGQKCLLSVIRDITEYKQADEKLRVNEARARAMLNAIPDMMFRMDSNGTFLDYKADTKDLYEQSVPLIGQRNRDISPPEFADLIEYKVEKTLSTSQMQTFEYQLPIANIGMQDFEARMAPSGANEVIAIVRNITEGKKAEMALLDTIKLQKQLEKTASVVPGAIYAFKKDVTGHISMPYASPMLKDIYGLEPAEVVTDAANIFAPIDPIDAPRLQASIAISAQNLTPWHDEFRYHHAQKGLRWMEGYSMPVSEADGSTIWYGITQDVTERKQAEQAVRESEEKYRSLLASLESAVIGVDESGRFLYLNDMAARQLGASAETLVGKNMQELFPEPVAARQLEDIRKVIHEDRAIVTEASTIIQDQLRWYRTAIQPVHDHMGQVAYALINSTDIHNLKMAETALRQQLDIERVVAEISQDFISINHENQEGIIQNTLSSLGRQAGVDRCYIFTYYPVENEFSHTHEWRANGIEPSGSHGRRFRPQDHPCMLQPILRGETINISRVVDLPDDDPAVAIMKAQGVRSMFCLPLSGEKGVLGLIGFDAIAQEHYWQETEIHLLSIVGRIIANGLAHLQYEQEILALNQSLEQRVYQLQLADESAQYRQRLLEQVIQLGKQVSAVTDLEQCLRAIYQAIRHGLNFDRVGLFLYDPDTQTAQGAYGTDGQGNMVDTHWYVTNVAHWWIWSDALRDSKGLSLIENYQASVNPSSESDMYGVKQYATLACWVGNRPVAMIAVDNLVSQRVMNAADLEALQFFAGYAGLAIETARLTTGLEQRVRERTEALRQSRSNLQAVLDTASDIIQSLDETGHYAYVNNAWCETLGYSTEEARQLTIWQVLDPAYHGHCEHAFREILATGTPQTLELVFCSRQGQAITVEGSVSVLDELDGRRTTNGFFRNITLRKQAEQAIRDSEAQLRISRDQLSAANIALEKAARMKDEFLASMSHELRTPLTGILGLSEALQLNTYGSLTEKQIRALKNIEESGRHLLELINDILDLSKIEAGMLELNIDPVVLNDVCQASLQLTKGMAHKKRLSVNFSIAPNSIHVRGDARRLKQMLVNLLSNAIKFTPENGSIGLEVQTDEKEQVVRLTIWDKGIGIAPENLQKLFQPFVQLESSLARQYEGTGLGLSLVRRMAELHGGSVQVESTPGEGSRFTILLPWMPNIVEPNWSSPKSSKLVHKALVIEDRELDGGQLTRYLRILGMDATLYQRGQGAVDLAARESPDMILLDLHLPDQSGFEVLAELKANPGTRNIPVIFCSVEEQRSQAISLGAAAYLVKPVLLPELRNEIGKVAYQLEQRSMPALAIAGTQRTVLIVDDNELVIETISDFLSTQNFRVVAAHSGMEMLEVVLNLHPDIILMDVQMPGMDGLEATRRIRSHSDSFVARTPIITLTALAMSGDRERCLAAGANEYMSKPVGLKQLAKTIRSMLDERHNLET